MAPSKFILFLLSSMRLLLWLGIVWGAIMFVFVQVFDLWSWREGYPVLSITTLFTIMAQARHLNKLPQGWEQYYTLWGSWRNRTVAIPTDNMSGAWPHIKAELRKERFAEIRKVSDTQIHLNNVTALWRHSQASLFLRPEGDHIVLSCTIRFPTYIHRFMMLAPELDAGTAMQVMQAVERGWQAYLAEHANSETPNVTASP